jgi:hypothetical protein
MTQSATFFDAAKHVLDVAGEAATASPSSLLEQWRDFVEQCHEGYGWDLSEYDNEVRVRTRIERLLRAPQLRHFPEVREYAARVALLDDQFRQLLQKDVVRPALSGDWWEKGVLRFGGEEYARDMRDRFGIHVLSVSEGS